MPVTYLEAIRQGLDEEMARDDRVFIIGEDVGDYGGAFKVTEGLLERFGARARHRHADLRDRHHRRGDRRGLHGHAAGGGDAVHRLHRVLLQHPHELRGAEAAIGAGRACRSWCAGPAAAAWAAGRFTPSTPRPISSTRRASRSWSRRPRTTRRVSSRPRFATRIRCSSSSTSTCIAASRTRCPDDDYIVADREGDRPAPGTRSDDCHVRSDGTRRARCGGRSLKADERRRGRSDRSAHAGAAGQARPCSRRSRRRTGACSCTKRARTGGIGAELAAIIAEEAFEYLDAPIVRLASLDTPVPYSPPLEAAFMPTVDKVAAAAKVVEVLNGILRSSLKP